MSSSNQKANALVLGEAFTIQKEKRDDYVIALAGNPNVGKSTVFNALTNLNQHTGNWAGKTVSMMQGTHTRKGKDYILVDLPGTYSLLSHSKEEEIARDFIAFGGADAMIVVCDATCLERNLNLVLQTLEITNRVIVCVNLMDEARKKGIHIRLHALSSALGVPVVGTSARSGEGLEALMEQVELLCERGAKGRAFTPRYPEKVEEAAAMLAQAQLGDKTRFLSLRLLEGNAAFESGIRAYLGEEIMNAPALRAQRAKAARFLKQEGITSEKLYDQMVSAIVEAAEKIYAEAVEIVQAQSHRRDRKLDRILMGKRTAIPIMLLLLLFVFWLTITGANYPSQWLANMLFRLQDHITALFQYLHAPDWLHGMLVLGVYRVLAWVVSVMLPPMAIFFPLFTLLEDFGYLPRVAFVLDHQFKKAKACGKQALTMCMGLGCNAAGVVGCRIIDSPRERLIAILTNCLIPCNGRFPTLIAIISMFFAGIGGGVLSTFIKAAILCAVIVIGILLTFFVSRFLSSTILKGEPSSFTLELPPYRTPQIGRVIVRSIMDRTIFVLGRAIVVAAPAGLIIWLLANTMIGDISLLRYFANLLNPFAYLLGLDGIILIAFILGFPANEIVMPIIIMAYLSTGTITELDTLEELKRLLLAIGWTWVRAVSTMLFCLVHWPCSTTCLTIKKETGSLKWTALSFILPTLIGMLACFLFTSLMRLIGFYA